MRGLWGWGDDLKLKYYKCGRLNMSSKKLTIRKSNGPALLITREAIKAQKMVYFAIATMTFKYKFGRFRIVYIGTTKNGSV